MAITRLQALAKGTAGNSTGEDVAETVNGLIDLTGVNSPHTIYAKMAAGEIVNIACYGDSTTDGNKTTGWTANPHVGTRDQNLFAPNAYPAVLESTLRELFNNNSISTWNAGYSGQRMDNGWAVDNYQAAVLDCAAYGNGSVIPDITIVAFGLNDIAITGSQIDDHIAQTEILIERIISDGTTPILLTTDPAYRNGQSGATRDSKEASRQIDVAKKSIAKKYGIQLIDVNLGIKKWIQNNAQGYNWPTEQDDGLHFSDNGAAFKASFIARHMLPDVVNFKQGETLKYINTWDSASSYIGDYQSVYKFSNNRQGGNVLYTSGAPQNTDMVELLVWNESPNANLIYLGIDHDNSTSTIAPSVHLKEYVEETEVSKNIISHGGYNSGFRRSDEHFIFGKLSYGLNRIKYKSGNSDALFYGSFKIVESESGVTENPLVELGRMRRGYTGNTGVYVDPIAEVGDLGNTTGGFDGDVVSISVDAILPENAGVLLLHGQGFTGNAGAITDELKCGVILFRRASGAVSIYNVRYNNLGAVLFSSPLVTSTVLTWPNNKFVGRVEISKSGDFQNYKIYDKFRGGTTIADTNLTLANSTRWSGFVGGIYYNSDTAGASASVELVRMQINRDYIAAQNDPDTPTASEPIDLIPEDNTWTGANTFSSDYLYANSTSAGAAKTYTSVMGVSATENVAIFGYKDTLTRGGTATTGLRIGAASIEWYDGTANNVMYHAGNFDPEAINTATQTAINGKVGLADNNTFTGSNEFTGGYVDSSGTSAGATEAHSAVMGASSTNGVAIFGVRNASGSGVANAGLRVSTASGLQWYDGASNHDVYHGGNPMPIPAATGTTLGGIKYTLSGSTFTIIVP